MKKNKSRISQPDRIKDRGIIKQDDGRQMVRQTKNTNLLLLIHFHN